MLLACCFREPKLKKDKKKQDKDTDEKDVYIKSDAKTAHNEHTEESKDQSCKPGKPAQQVGDVDPGLIIHEAIIENKCSSPGDTGDAVTTPKISRNTDQKQSHERPCFDASTPVSKLPDHHHQICSPTFTNISAIKKKDEHVTNKKDVRRMLATPEDFEESFISLSKINHLTNSTNNILQENEEKQEKQPPSGEANNLTYSKKTVDQHNDKSLEIEKLKQVIEEQKHRHEEHEKSINAIKQNFEAQVVILQEEHAIKLQEERNNFHLKLLEEREKHRKEVDHAKIIAKNSANETISELNKQIVLERAKMFTEQQEMKARLEEEFRMKEARLQQSLMSLEQSLNMVEQRERVWQEEKQVMMSEVERLKSETSKMIRILADEYEEEGMSEERKRSLSAEVYSLQLVVEMRSGEVRSLREKMASMTHQLEEASINQSKLSKAELRIEDLEEQLREKMKLEKQLSEEKSELEMDVVNTNKAMDRMSKDVEQLQWRIRNNFDLPTESVRSSSLNPPSSSPSKRRPSRPEFSPQSALLRSPKLLQKVITSSTSSSSSSSSPVKNSSPRKQSLFTVSDEMIEATTTVDNDTSEHFTEDSIEAPGDNNNDDQASVNNDLAELDNDDLDVDSLDEGVGDVSSDGEQASPSPAGTGCVMNTGQDTECPRNSQSFITTDANDSLERKISVSSPPVERIPSRFSFNNTT